MAVARRRGVPLYVRAVCSAAESVGDIVYSSGPEIGFVNQVRKVDPTDWSKMPGVAMIIEKFDATTCLIQMHGEVEDVYTGLTPGKMYFIGTDSRINLVPPIGYVQAVGVATSPRRVSLKLDLNAITLKHV